MFASALPYAVPALAAGLGFLGSEDTNESNIDIARMNNQFSAAQAAQNRAWEERMSDTAWQRGVADMRAAGINPMLAFSRGGASTPTASSATASPVAPMQNSLGSGISSAVQVANAIADIKTKESQIGLNVANAKTSAAQAANITAGTPTKAVESSFMNRLENTYTSAQSLANQFGKWLGNKAYDITHPDFSHMNGGLPNNNY